ncbi:MAG: hypothetical protein ACLPIG_20000, partial [Methylocella sp.]
AACPARSRACEEPSPLREVDRRSIGYGVSRSIMRANRIAICSTRPCRRRNRSGRSMGAEAAAVTGFLPQALVNPTANATRD